MATVELGTIARLVRSRAGMQTTAPSSAEVADDPELYEYCNEGLGAFHDLFIELQRHEHCVTPVKTTNYTMDSSSKLYALPKETLAVVEDGVRITNGTRSGMVLPFDNNERTSLLNATFTGDIDGFRYRVNGRNVEVYPQAGSTHTLSVDYVPEFQPLQTTASTFECPEGWWMWPVWYAVNAIMTMQERSVEQASAQLGFHDRRIRALCGRRAGRLHVTDRWIDRKLPKHYGRPMYVGRLVNG